MRVSTSAMSNDSRKGRGLSSRPTESLCVLTIRTPLDTGSVPITKAAIVRPRFTEYQREPGATSAFAGEAGHARNPLASSRVATSRTNVRSALGASDELLEVVAEAHHLVALRLRQLRPHRSELRLRANRLTAGGGQQDRDRDDVFCPHARKNSHPS